MGGAAFIGRVVSNRMQKTVVVAVSYLAYRPKLKLYEKRTAKHFAHADGDHANLDIGDVVRIEWAQRMSRHKHYKVTEVLRKSSVYTPELGAAAAAARFGPERRDPVEAARARAAGAAARLEALKQELDKLRAKGGGGGASGSSASFAAAGVKAAAPSSSSGGGGGSNSGSG